MKLASNETASVTPTRDIHGNWTREEALALYGAPFNDLLFQAQTVHRKHFDPNKVQLSRPLSIKTGGCPEGCGYLSPPTPQDFGPKGSPVVEIEGVVAAAPECRPPWPAPCSAGAARRSSARRGT